jgi:putative PIN family toxin of toxin-antitoxin system
MMVRPAARRARVVLDTNCLVSALIFPKGKLAWLREAWQSGRFVPLGSRDTVSELIRVLAYPKFRLGKDEQEALLADFLPYVETIRIERLPEGLPPPRDPDDMIFLALSVAAKTDALISGDADVQAAKHQLATVPILTVAEFAEWMKAHWN